MIKNKISGVICLLLFFTVVSCRKDLGNYDYKEINSAEISGINDNYAALSGQKLEIKPSLSFTMDDGSDTTKYAYEWFAVDDSQAPVTKIPIAKTRNLNWTVTLPSISKRYLGYYVVTDKNTGVSWRRGFSLNVNTNIVDGWLVLSDVNDKSRLDFYNYVAADNSFQFYADILNSMAKLNLNGKPKTLYYANRRDPFTNITARSIFIGSDQATFIINTQNNSFTNYVTLGSTINGYVPPPYFGQKIRNQSGNLVYLLDSEGQLFFENAVQTASFGTRVNRMADGQLIKISPYFAEGYTQSTSYALMFDVENKRFIEHKGISTASAVPTTTSTLFDPANIGMDLVFMDSTPALSGQTYALFKNSDGKIFLARIVCSANSFNPVVFEEVTTAPEIINATQFAIDPVEGYVMYLNGAKIYRYNPFDKTNAMVLDMGAKKVSLIKYQKMVFRRTDVRYAEYAKKLIVCTYDEASPTTSGKLDLYNVPNLNGPLTLYTSFSGFGKIIEVTYRE